MENKHNPITKASQYQLMEGVEVRDVINVLLKKLWVTEQQFPNDILVFASDYTQMLQYLMRFMDKGGKQDLEKGRYYLDKLILAYENQ